MMGSCSVPRFAACFGALCALPSLAAASPFYDYDIVARDVPGLQYVGPYSGGPFIPPGASINDKGEVAFVGQNTGGYRVFRWNPVTGLIALTLDDHSTIPLFRRPQVMNDGRVISSMWRNESVLTDYPRASLYGPGAGAETVLAQFQPGSFASVTSVSANNLGDAVFQYNASVVAGQQNQITLYYHDHTAAQDSLVPFATFTGDPAVSDMDYRPRLSDDDTTVMRAGDTDSAPIVAYKSNGPQVVASGAMGFSALGKQPGISDDGSILVFLGNLSSSGATTLGTTPGPGIFACTREGADFSPPFRVTGGTSTLTGNHRADLGYDGAGNSLYFSSYDPNGPVGVSHLHTGATSSLDGDSFTVCFLASPNAPSRPNPGNSGKPFLFTQQRGLWTVRVDIEKQLSDPKGRVYHPWGAVPVAQIGDTFGGSTITDITLGDPIARVSTDKLLNPRTQHRMDHQLAFSANTNNGSMIVRARYLDSDEDGLPDHWEQPGGGVDIDGDGIVDLDLPAMGAEPFRRDMFLQIDWLADDSTTDPPHVHEPAPGVTKALADMFANAPALPNGIPAGINLHIDAGVFLDKGAGSLRAPFSQNMGRGILEGGNLIPPVDVIYFDTPGAVTNPGVTTRAFQDIKDSIFLREDKGARELAFRYAVLGDFRDFLPSSASPIGGSVQSATSSSLTAPFTFGTTFDSGAVKITSGPGAGQVRSFVVPTSGPTIQIEGTWTTTPTSASTFVLLNDSSGQAEVFFQPGPDFGSLPGNDFVMSVGAWRVNLGGYLTNTCVQWRTLAHEMGHTLGLRHGGVDGRTSSDPTSPDYKPNYKSLMNYAYQLICSPPSGVRSYSGASDAVFPDWLNLKPEFHMTPLPLVETPKDGTGFGDSPDVEEPEPTLADYLRVNGHLPDITPPAVSIASPASGAVIPLNAPLTVSVTVTDDQCVDQVFVEFDANGDGVFGPDEFVTATPVGGSSYQATFSSVTGPNGNRVVNAYALDCGGNQAETTNTIGAGSVITSLSVSPVLFDPAVRTCTITATGGVGLQPEVRIKTGNSTYIRSVPLSATVSGAYSGVWEGRDNTNTVVPAGTYYLEAWNSQTNTQYTPTATVKVVLGTKIWRVNRAAPGPTHDGTSWTTAFLKVQDGINAAASGDDVWVAAGTYPERITLKGEVGLYGGFAGTELARDQRSFRANATVLDGGQGGSVVTVFLSPSLATVLDGFTVRNGGLPNYGTSQGGGVNIPQGSVATIANNLITGNRAADGAGLYVGSGGSLVANNALAGDAASGRGGAMFVNSFGGSATTVANNVVVANTAKSGGGSYLLGGAPVVLNNTFADNLGIANGGGVTCDNTTAALVNNIVSANSSGIYRTGAGAPSFASNCVWGNAGYGYSGVADATGAGGNIAANPQFALPAFGNVHIQPASPCADAGTAGYDAGSLDMDGQARIQGARVDIGADESDGTTWPGAYPVIRVSPSGSDANDGSSWAQAKRTVQGAVSGLAAGGEVWVQGGTYTERVTPGAFTYLYGGFGGTETSRGQRNVSANPTVLDGGAGGAVVTISAPGFALETVDGFTLRNGSGATVQGITSGGGMYCRDSAPTVVNCAFTANAVTSFSSFGGGGLFAYYAAPSVTGCAFTANSAALSGGAVSGYYSAITLTNCAIAGNTAGSQGGGVYGYQTAVWLSGGSVTNNVGGGNLPAGIYCDSQGSLTASGLTIAGNKGDGIVSVQSPATVSSCTINGQVGGRGVLLLSCPSINVTGNTVWGNPGSTRGPGGGLCISGAGGGSVLGNVIFANAAQNSAVTIGAPQYPAQAGGGIFVDSPVTVANNAIFGNLANGGGGGIYCALSSPALVNNTIVYNNAATGGGVCVGAGTPTIMNTIIAFNSSGIAITGGAATLKNNDVYANDGYLGANYLGIPDPTGASGNISADPLLASPLTGDVHIPAASPCRDAGDSSAVPAGWTDVYGQPRIQGAAVDIGAEETPGSVVPPPPPTVVFVTPTGSDANSGASWALAKKTLTGALAAAASGNEIWVAAGTYSETITLKKDVALLGGFIGSETLKGQRDPRANATVIDGGQNGSVVTVPPYSLPATVLDGFTLRNGTGITPAGLTSRYGGGIYGANASPTIANCMLTSNAADVGAGMYLAFGAPVITNLTATGNTASGTSAAVQFSNAMPYLTGGSVSNNAGSGLEMDGNGRLYASGLTVTGNSGRGISVVAASATISGCTVTGQAGGSGIYLAQCPLATVAGCTVSGNSGAPIGAGFYVDSVTAGFIGANTVTGNVASQQAGGMYLRNNTALTVASNVFQANIGGSHGGGIYVSTGAAQVTNNTLVQNTATDGGAIAVSGGTPALANNILALNTSGLDVTGGTVSLKNNCVYANASNQGYDYAGIAEPTGTNGNISADPAFANIAAGNVRIQGTSPCVDAGDPGSAAGGTDVYGQPRVQGARVDIGAAESDGTVFPPPVARIVYVSKTGNDANTGLSWGQAKLTVGAALAMALPGDEIWTAAGTYAEHVTLANGAALYGGFVGTETQRSARDVQADPAILDGGGAGSVVAFPQGALPSTAMDGFTVRNGAGTPVPGYGGDTGGGGILAANTSGTIANCTVTQNNATYGSGIFAWQSNIAVSGSSVSQNMREGVAVWGGSVTLDGLIISSNAYDGVSIQNTGTVSVRGCLATNNGHIGVVATGGSVAVTGTTVSNHSYGGLYLASCTTALVQGCTISGNTGAPSGGGLYVGFAGSASVLNNTITGNVSAGDGGGLWASAGVVVANNLISSNGASGNGGGVYCDGSGNGATSIVNNTLTGNFSVGGALHVNAGAPVIANNIVAGNSSGVRVTSGAPVTRNNCVFGNDVANYIGLTDPTGSFGNISVDPQVLVYGPQAGHIQAASPCVNAGDGSFVSAGWTDLDGQARIQGGRVDIGADESNGTTYVPVNPPVVYVRPDGNDTNDGSSWALAKKTVGAALSAAQTDGEIWAAAGTYLENLTLKNRVSLYGGFTGSETQKSQRDPTAHPTILDGGGTGSIGVFAAGPMRTARLDGVTLRHGAGTPALYGVTRGGALSIANAALALANCTVSGNTTAGSGGGIAALASSLAVNNCTVTGNTAGSDFNNYGGGGVYADASTVGVSGGSFTSNKVMGTTLEGSAICGVNNATVLVTGTSVTGNLGFADTVECRFGSSLTISGATISNNGSRGVSVDSGPALVTGCTISANGSNGVYLVDCPTATIQGCRIIGNMTGLYVSSGSAPYFVYTTGLIADNVIASNTMPSAPSFGGGGLVLASNQRLASNLITGNTSSTNGGGIYIPSGSPQIVNNTIVSNTSAAGGGIYVASGTPMVVNNIIASNSSGVNVHGGTTALRNNDVFANIGGNYTGTTDPTGSSGNISADPLFANAPGGDFHLHTPSPCIDAGDDTVVTPTGTDLDGMPRIQGPHVDIGAYELASAAPYTFAEAIQALRVAGGLRAASTADMQRLNVAQNGPSGSSLDSLDAARLARKAAGLDPNP